MSLLFFFSVDNFLYQENIICRLRPGIKLLCISHVSYPIAGFNWFAINFDTTFISTLHKAIGQNWDTNFRLSFFGIKEISDAFNSSGKWPSLNIYCINSTQDGLIVPRIFRKKREETIRSRCLMSSRLKTASLIFTCWDFVVQPAPVCVIKDGKIPFTTITLLMRFRGI